MDLLEFGACFDWVSPTLAIFQSLANGPHHTFSIPSDCGWSGRDIARMLEGMGVRSWGHMVVDGYIMLTVKRQQATWAQNILTTADIPIASEPPRQKRQKQRAESSWWSPFE